MRFTAFVSEDGKAASGKVTFKADDVTLGPVSLHDGVATLSTRDLTGGGHTITAKFAGNRAFAASSGRLRQKVRN